jgi:hypothetical protein
MYSPSRKVRVSVRRTQVLTVIIFVSSLLLAPTRSAGHMLTRSQSLLAKQITLEPTSFMCQTIAKHIALSRSVSSAYPLYIVVKTRADTSGIYFQRRMFTRKSWAREAQSLGIPVIYAVGRPNHEQVQNMLDYENKIYGDMLQFNYLG